MKQRLFMLTSLLLICAPGIAQASQVPEAGATATPPAIAVQACEGETEGAAVEYSLKGGKVFQGNCAMINGRLVAVPMTPIQPPLNEIPGSAPSSSPEMPKT